MAITLAQIARFHAQQLRQQLAQERAVTSPLLDRLSPTSEPEQDVAFWDALDRRLQEAAEEPATGDQMDQSPGGGGTPPNPDGGG